MRHTRPQNHPSGDMSTERRGFADHLLTVLEGIADDPARVEAGRAGRDMAIPAILRLLETVCEAASDTLPESIKRQYPTVDWNAISGMRARLAEAYPTAGPTLVKATDIRDSAAPVESARAPSFGSAYPAGAESMMAASDDLFLVARQAMKRAHAPYSSFPVGAAIRSESGRIFAGANIENASYPEGWCAETSAISNMVLGGERRIEAVAVVAAKMARITPCGGCRQRLREFGTAGTLVYLCDPTGVVETVTLGDLLPKAFDLK